MGERHGAKCHIAQHHALVGSCSRIVNLALVNLTWENSTQRKERFCGDNKPVFKNIGEQLRSEVCLVPIFLSSSWPGVSTTDHIYYRLTLALLLYQSHSK